MIAKQRHAWLQLLPAGAVLGVLFLAPMALMLGVSFREKGPAGTLKPLVDFWHLLRTGGLFHNYRDALAPMYAPVYWRSFYIALSTTLLCLVIGYPTAYYIALVAGPRHKNLLLALVAVPFWTSFLIRMGAWQLILGTQGVLNTFLSVLHLGPYDMLYTPGAVLIGLVYGELPFMILPLYASLEKMDRSLLQAAADLGAPPVACFWRITVPQTLPGIIAGAVLVFIPSAGQFVVSDILGGAKASLVGNVISDGFSRNKPLKSAMAFELTAAVLVLLAAQAIYLRKRRPA